MSSLHARATRLRIAEVVQARPRRGPDDQLRVARWLLDAGAPVPPDVAVEAAGAANLAGDPELGGRLAELAFAGPRKAEAALQLARAHAMRKQFAEAEAVLADAEEQFTDQEPALRALEHRVTLLYWALHRPADALAFIERAATRWSDHAWRARVESVRLYLLIWSEPALVIDATAAQLGHPATPDDVRPRLSIVRAGALFYAGRGREAHALARPLRPAIPLAGTHEQITFDDCAMIDLETAEDLVETERWLSDSLAAAVASRDDVAAGLAAWSLAELCRLTARLDDAERWIAEATAQFSRRDPFGYLSLTHALAAGIALERDDYETAAAASARSAETIPGSVIDVPEQPNRARADAWALLAAGDAVGARRVLLDAAQRVAHPLYSMRLAWEAMRYGAPPAEASMVVQKVIPHCDARLAGAFASHVRAAAAGDAAALLAAAEQLAAVGTVHWASEAAAAAAESFAAAGDADAARRAARRSYDLHALGQGGALPVIRGLDLKSVELTPREAQFVDLAASGLTNAEIADRLILSVRTVESHLYRAMQKLGVRDRRELTPRSGRAAARPDVERSRP